MASLKKKKKKQIFDTWNFRIKNECSSTLLFSGGNANLSLAAPIPQPDSVQRLTGPREPVCPASSSHLTSAVLWQGFKTFSGYSCLFALLTSDSTLHLCFNTREFGISRCCVGKRVNRRTTPCLPLRRFSLYPKSKCFHLDILCWLLILSFLLLLKQSSSILSWLLSILCSVKNLLNFFSWS